MENTTRFSGGGGTARAAFIRDVRTIYRLELRDLQEEQLEGFGQWEYLNLPGVTLAGEARDVHRAFMGEWNYVDKSNPNYRRARHDFCGEPIDDTGRCSRPSGDSIALQQSQCLL